MPVSYTHLDVDKRQIFTSVNNMKIKVFMRAIKPGIYNTNFNF